MGKVGLMMSFLEGHGENKFSKRNKYCLNIYVYIYIFFKMYMLKERRPKNNMN